MARRSITRRTRGTFSCWRLADRKCWRPATSEMGMQWSARYVGAWLRRHRWTVTASLYCTRWGMSSQCSSSWSSRDRPRSYLPVPEIRRAAAFNTVPYRYNMVPAFGVKKTRMMGLPGREKEVWRYLQPSGYNTLTWRTDRGSDGQRQTPSDSKDRAYS